MMDKNEIFGFVAAVVVGAAAFYISSQLDFLGEWGYAGAFLAALVSSATVIMPAPGWAVVMGMASRMNPVLLGAAAGVGSAIGELTGYMVGYSGRMIVSKEKLPEYRRQKRWLKNADMAALFVLAALPNPVFDIAGIASGALRIPLRKFLLAVALGKIVKFIGVAYLGNFATAYI